jgi:hypothetical protein
MALRLTPKTAQAFGFDVVSVVVLAAGLVAVVADLEPA